MGKPKKNKKINKAKRAKAVRKATPRKVAPKRKTKKLAKKIVPLKSIGERLKDARLGCALSERTLETMSRVRAWRIMQLELNELKPSS